MENKNEWRKVSLGELCNRIFSGGTPNTKINEYWNGNINWLSSGETRNNYITNTEKKITEKGIENSSTKLALKNNIIIASAGQGYTRGQVSYCLINTYINQSIICLESNNKLLNSKFLYFNLKNKYNELRQISDGHSSRGSLTTQIIKELMINLPPLDIQKKIAKILSDIDEKIELNNKINDNLEKQCITIFNKMFPQIFYGNFKVGTYLKPKRGKNLLVKNAIIGNIPVVAGGLEPAIYHNQSNTQSPVITISASGANAGFIRLWHIPVWSSDSSYIDFSVSKFIYFWYVFLKLRQKEIFDLQSGSAQPHIYPKHIEDLSINKLDLNLVESFNNIISSFFKKIGENNLENEKLINLKNYLLPKLMNGEINVENIEL